ncbi:hypothetical protein N7U66_04860 [Lacinutrix neustonica]|uniref:Uncharacterized protein n=1 Tax=Lacinutrix neustonica TaxID=2980107 RepID=A0A9E8MWS3_9FLAO|nr:hypothetical protein [Lacinutrix neustonica]WAC02963.1 hypothetical protein N7U66_04860 [Lacinutrix neustonica]
MKYLKIIIILTLFYSCKTENKNEFFEINLTEKTVVGISPDSIQIAEMKKEYGEDDFYTIADDVMWYNGQMLEVIDSLKIQFVHTDKRLVRIITPNDRIEINNDTSQVKWRYIYFNGKETLEKDVFEIIDLNKFYE